MAHPLQVTAEDWNRFRKIVRSVNQGSAKREAKNATAELARSVRQELRELEERGVEQARRLLDAVADTGAQAAVKAVLKEENGTISLGYNGTATIVRMPTVYGVRRHDPETGEVLKQSELWRWFSLTWDDFEALINSLRAQGRVLEERADALATVLPLRDKHPDSATPLDAIEREGLDPMAFSWQ
jgi:hypothetical protein